MVLAVALALVSAGRLLAGEAPPVPLSPDLEQAYDALAADLRDRQLLIDDARGLDVYGLEAALRAVPDVRLVLLSPSRAARLGGLVPAAARVQVRTGGTLVLTDGDAVAAEDGLPLGGAAQPLVTRSLSARAGVLTDRLPTDRREASEVLAGLLPQLVPVDAPRRGPPSLVVGLLLSSAVCGVVAGRRRVGTGSRLERLAARAASAQAGVLIVVLLVAAVVLPLSGAGGLVLTLPVLLLLGLALTLTWVGQRRLADGTGRGVPVLLALCPGVLLALVDADALQSPADLDASVGLVGLEHALVAIALLAPAVRRRGAGAAPAQRTTR